MIEIGPNLAETLQVAAPCVMLAVYFWALFRSY